MEKSSSTPMQRKLFEDAIDNAQYLVAYAASRCEKKIEAKTLATLVSAKRFSDNHEKIDAEFEAKFWLAYQDIWDLVKPVTAESIKANLPIEGTFTSKLFEKLPFLSRWWGVRATSKARKTVNRYIIFTVFVLILLLILQIYWVIGNQLTTQSAELIQRETDLTLQINENQQEYSKLEIRYKQNEIDSGKFNGAYYTFYDGTEWERDILEYTSTKATLETNSELLKSQLERNSAILLVWSGPWKWLIEDKPQEGAQSHNDKYAPLFASIDGQLASISEQLVNDPDGTKAAEAQKRTVDAQLAGIEGQLGALFEQYDNLDKQELAIQEKIKAIDDKSALEGRLTDLAASVIEIQGQIDNVNTQLNPLLIDPNADATIKSDLETQLIDLKKSQEDIQKQIDEVNNQLNAFIGNPNVAESKSALEAQLPDIGTNKAAIRDQILNLQSQIQYFVIDQQALADQITTQLRQDQKELRNEKKNLERQELADANREKSRQAQLAGQLVLGTLQSYLLPLLYGILGAGTFILRSLSKQIEKVIFSEEASIQHLLRISLGALAGIMVGWFSFLIDNGTPTFLASVSPMAIAFLVGYNIELFFSTMDIAINKLNEIRQQTLPAPEDKDQKTARQKDSTAPSTQEPPVTKG